MSEEVIAQFPPKIISPLWTPSRYKVFYGGRGGAKSWSIARALLIMGCEQSLRVLCAREFQSSISDSVHKLLSDQIYELNLEDYYTIEKQSIYCSNGTEFRFAGIRTNVQAIKSFEGIDICWVEEAQNVSKSSWDTLIPTIRKDKSSIWISFNPELESDDTYKRFVLTPPPNAQVVKINWSDNPFFPKVLDDERLYLKDIDPDGYLNIWEGHPRSFLDGAVYSKELRKAIEEDRITNVPYDPSVGVNTFWDLGFNDNTSITFGQVVAMQNRVIDYIEDNQKPIHEYIKMLQERPYTYGTHFLPHDAKARQLGSGRSIEEILRAHGFKVQIVPRLSVEDGINAARTMFPNIFIDANKCEALIQCIRKYRYDVTNLYNKANPIHDWSSHGADSFRYMAVALKAPKPPPPKFRPAFTGIGAGGWMS